MVQASTPEEIDMTNTSCHLEIRAAEGGADARIFAADLARAYLKFAHSKG